MLYILKRIKRFKIWFAVCFIGEELYLIVMFLIRFFFLSEIKILVIDIDDDVIRKVKEGVYMKKSLEGFF